MTVKIPMMTPLPASGYVGNHRATPAWRNFRDSLSIPFTGTIILAETGMIREALKEYDAVWCHHEGVIEFETEEQATMWILRWS